MQKLYCYVDETGQDTMGEIFIVSVVIIIDEKLKNELLAFCEELEKTSGKGKFKWGKARNDKRLNYLESIFRDNRFKKVLRYSLFSESKKYDELTIEGIAKAICWKEPKNYTSLIYIDGLAKSKYREYTLKLRRRGASVQKVKGVRKNENNALTRLADAIAGFVRDVKEDKDQEAKKLFNKAKKKKFLIEL